MPNHTSLVAPRPTHMGTLTLVHPHTAPHTHTPLTLAPHTITQPHTLTQVLCARDVAPRQDL